MKPTALDSTVKIVQKVAEQSPGTIWLLVEAHNFLSKWIACRDTQKISRKHSLHIEDLNHQNTDHSPFNPSVCNWNNFPNSNGRTRNWLLFKSSSLLETMKQMLTNNTPISCVLDAWRKNLLNKIFWPMYFSSDLWWLNRDFLEQLTLFLQHLLIFANVSYYKYNYLYLVHFTSNNTFDFKNVLENCWN